MDQRTSDGQIKEWLQRNQPKPPTVDDKQLRSLLNELGLAENPRRSEWNWLTRPLLAASALTVGGVTDL